MTAATTIPDLENLELAAKPVGRNRPRPLPALSLAEQHKQICDGLAAADLPINTSLTPEQQHRALNWPKGLRKHALATYILEGKTMSTQVNEARAAREKAERETETNKPKATTSRRASNGMATRYPEDIRQAVKLAKQARGTDKGAPGCKQHVLVRKEIKGLDAAGIIKLSGAGTEKRLREIADGTASKDDLKLLREFSGRFTDQFCKGRNLASMLVAAVEQSKAAEQGTPRPKKTTAAQKTASKSKKAAAKVVEPEKVAA